MDLVKEIVKAFCVIAIALSITEFLLPNTALKRCIRFIVGLIFIVSVINPFLSEGLSLNTNILSEPDLNKLEHLQDNISEALISDFEKNTEEALKKKLIENGYEISSVDIKAKADEYNNTVIEKITVLCADDADAIKEEISKFFETEDIEIEVKKNKSQ